MCVVGGELVGGGFCCSCDVMGCTLGVWLG